MVRMKSVETEKAGEDWNCDSRNRFSRIWVSGTDIMGRIEYGASAIYSSRLSSLDK
jgi:hypothetical protein